MHNFPIVVESLERDPNVEALDQRAVQLTEDYIRVNYIEALVKVVVGNIPDYQTHEARELVVNWSIESYRAPVHRVLMTVVNGGEIVSFGVIFIRFNKTSTTSVIRFNPTSTA